MNCNNCASNQKFAHNTCSKLDQVSESCNQFFVHPNQSYFLPVQLTHKLQDQIEQCLPELMHGVDYTFKQLCGKAFWKGLSKLEHNLAYNCVDFLIEHEELAIENVGYAGKKGYVFQLK
jgi:hypothetical protein